MSNFMRCIALFVLLASNSTSSAADWEPMVTDLLKTEKLGYGGLTGVVVDRQTSNVYIWLSDKGLYKSTDQAKSFTPFGKPTKGRTEWPGCMLTNPSGPLKIWTIALVYGEPIITSTDGGANWAQMDKKSMHVDWVAVDWSDPERKFVLTLKHESGDLLLASNDGGKEFREVGKGFGPACIFDNKTAVVVQIVPGELKKPAKRVLARTADAAKTFEKVADFSTRAVPVWFKDKPYWLVDGAIITSKDKGKTWEQFAAIKNGQFGPIFGKDEKQLFVLTPSGVVMSTDGGEKWSAPLVPPKEMKGLGPLSWIAFDTRNNIIYLMKMGSDLYRIKL
jgi:photosystem II stability/assembly factor-like uncharacterized protein